MKKTSLFFIATTILVAGLSFNYFFYKVDAESKYSDEFYDAYNFAYKNGITTMSNIDKAKMNSSLTRIAMAKMLSNYAINVLGMKPDTSTVPNFKDVSQKLDEQYGGAVTLAYQLGIMGINMKNNEFRPYNTVTRGEFGTALSRMLYKTPDGSPYYATHLDKLKREGIITNTKSKLEEKRGYVMVMLMRSQNSGLTTNANNSNTINDDINNKDTKLNTSEKYLTQDEVQKLIEKQEGLKEDDLDSKGYGCSYIGNSEICTYEFRYSINGKKYIYYRDNTASGEIRKIQDLGINNAENVALKDSNLSRNDVKIEQSFGTDGYGITLKAKDNVFIYSISLDGKIEWKKVLITEKKALVTVLKEVNLEQSQADIEKENKEICSLSYSYFNDEHDIYHCSFTYLGKQYLSYINAHNGSIIPIKKTGSSIQYGKSVTGKENVIISENFTYIDSDKAEELLTKKYNIKNGGSSRTMKVGEGENAIYVYSIDDTEYYIDAINGTKMNSKEEIVSAISKDSGVSKTIIKKNKKDNEERESVDNTIIELNYSDGKTKEVCSIYSFTNQGTTYTYRIRNIDGKILDSEKEADIGKDKAIELAKQTIKNKYSIELNDDYEDYNRSRAYIRYLENAPTVGMPKAPSKPEYIICFTDKDEKNIYRVILKPDGNIISDDKVSVEEMGFLSSMYYTMGYSIEEINELKDKPIEIGGSFSL